MKLKKITVLIITGILITGCGAAVGDGASDDEDDSADNNIPFIENKSVKIKTALKCKKGTSLNYDNFGEGFLLNYCTSCHATAVLAEDRIGAPEDVNFETPELAQVWRTNILKSLKDKKNPMPPTQDLSETEKTMFKEWLDCGAPSGTDNI